MLLVQFHPHTHRVAPGLTMPSIADRVSAVASTGLSILVKSCMPRTRLLVRYVRPLQPESHHLIRLQSPPKWFQSGHLTDVHDDRLRWWSPRCLQLQNRRRWPWISAVLY